MNKNLKKAISCLLILFVFTMNLSGFSLATKVEAAGGITYYLDSTNGSDSNNGTSSSTPWKTLSKINSITLQPGDKVLFAAGKTWYGVANTTGDAFKPKGSGTATNPIVIDMYGTGNKPIIQGPGTHDSCGVYIKDSQYIEINNLKVTNPGTTTNSEKRKGIFVVAYAPNFTGTQSNPSVLNHIYVRNCEVTNVNSNVAGMGNYDKNCGGIVVNVQSMATDTSWVTYNDIRIENNYIHDLSRQGIFIYSDFCRDQPYTVDEGTRPRTPLTNVAVRNNYVADVAGDGIVVVAADSPVIERNLVARPQRAPGSNLYAVGMWPFGCKNAVMQYNESYGNQTMNDGQGYDVDYANRDTVVQYNYSHDNEGGFILVCAGPGKNSGAIVRYNISQNDGAISGSRIFQITGAGTSGVQVYNNTVYTSTTVPKIVASSANEWEGAPASSTFKNNIIYNRNSSSVYETTSSTTFVNNDFYGGPIPSNSTGHITSNPQFVSGGTATTGGRVDTGASIGNVDGYKLNSSSPCINTGVTVSNNGGRDYWGTTLSGTTDIGACEYGITTTVATPTLTPGSTTFTTTLSVTIGCGTSGATIRYTTDGSTPTASSPIYTGAITVSSTTTIKAKAFKSGLTDSAVASETYTKTSDAKTIPGQIEAEAFDAQNGGVQKQTCSEGGENVGWIDTGDWMDYTVNVQTAGNYQIIYRVASQNGGGQVKLKIGGTDVYGSVATINSTGDWQNWTDVVASCYLNAGTQTIRVYAGAGGFNLNWFKFIKVG